MHIELLEVCGYFNSQPHKEADFCFRVSLKILLISTHSLTRRLTLLCLIQSECFHISTHSLTRRLTMLAASFASILIISTHSLTRRLTVTLTNAVEIMKFQLTASQGG